MINENDFLYSQTDGIIVSACPVLLEENPAAQNLWGYYLCIENNSKKKIHLVGKNWNIADARGKVCTERRLEARKDDQVQQRCDPAEKQVGQLLIVFLDDVFEFLHDVPVLRL